MSTHIAIGFSSINDPVEAFKAAAIEAKSQLNAVQTDLVIVFTSSGYAQPQGLETLQQILHPARMIGAITPGILIGTRAESRGVGIMAIISDDLHFGISNLDKLSLMLPHEAGYNLAKSLLSDHKASPRSACIYFYDGLRKNGSQLCSGVRESLGSALPIIGIVGMNSAGLDHSRHFYQTSVLDDAAVGLLIGGASTVCLTARHSWQPLGKPRIIDASSGNIIHLIDKQPAVRIYEDYFCAAGEKIQPEQLQDIRLLYPLGLGTTTPREYLVRAPIDILVDGSIVCQGDIPAGSSVHLMITDKDACRQSMHDAAVDIRDQLFGKTPKCVFVFESFMRRKILGRNATQGLHAIRDILGATVPVFGMYTISEVAPSGALKNVLSTQLINGSFALLAIG